MIDVPIGGLLATSRAVAHREPFTSFSKVPPARVIALGHVVAIENSLPDTVEGCTPFHIPIGIRKSYLVSACNDTPCTIL